MLISNYKIQYITWYIVWNKFTHHCVFSLSCFNWRNFCKLKVSKWCSVIQFIIFGICYYIRTVMLYECNMFILLSVCSVLKIHPLIFLLSHDILYDISCDISYDIYIIRYIVRYIILYISWYIYHMIYSTIYHVIYLMIYLS